MADDTTVTLNIAQAVLIAGQRDDGNFGPIQLDNNNALKAGSGSGGGGNGQTGLATEAKQDEQMSRMPELVNGRLPVAVESMALADGAATASAQATQSEKLDDIATLLMGLDEKTPMSGEPQPVSATALPLPEGAATLAKQDAILAAIESIEQKTPEANVPRAVSVDELPLPDNAAKESGGNLAILAQRAPVLVNGRLPVELPASPAAAANAPAASRLTDGNSFYVAAKAGDNMGADLRVAGAPVAGGNPVPISDAGQSITVDSLQLPSALVGGRLPVDGSGVVQPVSASALPLPSGASTEARQATGNASLASLDGKAPALVNGRMPTDGSGVTQPISAASLPLPSGAATEARQINGNASLSSLDTKAPALVNGRLPVDGSGTTQPISATALPLPQNAAQETGGNLATLVTRTPVLGQAAAGASSPVVLPLSQAAGALALQAQLPAALGASGGLKIEGVSGGVPVPVAGTISGGAGLPLGSTNAAGSRPIAFSYGSRPGNAASLPAAATSFLIVSGPASLCSIEFRYTLSGTKYVVLLDAASAPGTAAQWIRWYRPITNAMGLYVWEFMKPKRFTNGIVVAISAAEPTTTLTLSTASTENFTLVGYDYDA